MKFSLFFFYTALGSAIWTSILAFSGFFIGHKQDVIESHIDEIVTISIAVSIILTLLYISKRMANAGKRKKYKKRKKRS